MLLKPGALTSVNVAKALVVSEETVRRDFEKLEVDILITGRKPGNAVKQGLQKGGAKLILPEEK